MNLVTFMLDSTPNDSTFAIIPSAEIIAISHDLSPQKVAFWKENGTILFQGNLGWWNII